MVKKFNSLEKIPFMELVSNLCLTLVTQCLLTRFLPLYISIAVSYLYYCNALLTKITLDGLLRGKIAIKLKIEKFSDPFIKDKSIGL